MGILADDTEVVPALAPEQFAGPGTAHTGYGEYNQREFLNRWADQLAAPASSAASVEVGGGNSTRNAATRTNSEEANDTVVSGA